MSARFVASQLDNGVEWIELLQDVSGGLLRRATSEKVPAADWPKVAPQAGLSALAAARTNDVNGEISEEEHGVALPARFAAGLNDVDAQALGIPSATALTLQLRSGGSLVDGSIHVETKWVRRGGVPVRADIVGARVRDGSRVGRIVEPLYAVYHAAKAVNDAVEPDARRAAFAELRDSLGDQIHGGINADGFIERIRIAYAAKFSLDAKTSHGRFDFDPVLFSRQAEDAGNGELLNEADAALLTAHDNNHFQRRFRSQEGGKRSYLLPDGTILFVDPVLGKALDIVRRKQNAAPAERRAFLRSPQRVLREELGLDSANDDEAADRLFIETQQFSERVSGIEVWQKPVLPWIKPKPNSWLPEGFGLRIGEPPNSTHIELQRGDAEAIVQNVTAAMESNQETIDWQGETIPASLATLRAAEAIAALERDATANAAAGEALPPGETFETLDTFFLQVGENFEQLDYSRLPRPEAPAAPFVIPPMPKGLASSPKPHQQAAFAWLVEAWSRKMPGVLLADDMGLGKTYQALAFLLWLKNQERIRPILIVAPTGLLRNWLAEISQHLVPGAMGSIVEAFGSELTQYRSGSGNDIRGGTSRLDVSGWADAGIVLTTYETMRDYHMSFARIRFAAIVYDEIQKLKNPASQMTRAAKALNADIQIAMTGTPVENRLQDIWSIADTVYPGFLGSSREFEANYPHADWARLTELQAYLVERDGNLPPFMLRRMKEEILTGLPEKTSQKYAVVMPTEQAEAYDRVLARARALRESGEKGAMLKVLHMLRGTSLHPSPPRSISDVGAYVAQSARLTKTFELLADIRDQHEKALVFCEDLEMQSFLAMAIQEHFELPKRPMCISGNVPGPKRQDMVSAFQSAPPGFDVMILSPKAGGVGLTITAANHVIHLSRWWNPAVEDQATDRVYRIGQKRPVTVHIPIATHPDPAIASSSFDKRLDELMDRKRTLSRGLLMPAESDAEVEQLLSDVLDGRSASPQFETTAEMLDAAPRSAEAPISPVEPHVIQPEETAEPDTKTSSGDSRDQLSHVSARARRPILTATVSPIEEAERRTSSIRRVQFEQHGQRDWAIFTQYLTSAEIDRLDIQDPYCCADESARGRLLNFVKRFSDNSMRLDSVYVLTFDADSIETRRPESTQQQRDDLEGRWRSALPHVELHLTQRSRRSGGDLHDRFVKAKFNRGGAVIWDLGRGIDGVMNAKWSCVVNAFHEQSPNPQ